MLTSKISEALGLIHDFVEAASYDPEAKAAAIVWAAAYGGNLSMAQTRAFFDALRPIPNMHEVWDAYNKLDEGYHPPDKFGRPMCFQNFVAHAIADRSQS